uniref:Regulator of microtubule dynamics protein 1 n=1 Tax=Pelusios castaneus TaxID=367368 RepID=A0A8C8RNE2_9SAUR
MVTPAYARPTPPQATQGSSRYAPPSATLARNGESGLVCSTRTLAGAARLLWAGICDDHFRCVWTGVPAGAGRRGAAHHGGSGVCHEAFAPWQRLALARKAASIRVWRRLAAARTVEEILEQADYLYGSGETRKLYQLLILHKNSGDAEILWRLARASHDLAQLSTFVGEKKQLVYEAFAYAAEALKKNESSSAVHKWYAICIGDIGDFEGTRAKIVNAYAVKEHLQKAIELNPKDATSIHLMGLWCYSFAEMSWYQRKISSLIFAPAPNATYEEALSYFQMAEKVDPNFCSYNLLLLAKTCLKLNNKKLALLWLTKARDYPAHTEKDKEVQKEAVELLHSI